MNRRTGHARHYHDVAEVTVVEHPAKETRGKPDTGDRHPNQALFGVHATLVEDAATYSLLYIQ